MITGNEWTVRLAKMSQTALGIRNTVSEEAARMFLDDNLRKMFSGDPVDETDWISPSQSSPLFAREDTMLGDALLELGGIFRGMEGA